jgi:hypothetical protein
MRGDTARILRRQAIVIENNPDSTDDEKKTSTTLRLQAALAKVELAEMYGLDLPDADMTSGNDRLEDETYDLLVCGYFR